MTTPIIEQTVLPKKVAPGFTLVELLVTICVIGLLLAVGIPGFHALTDGARLSARVAMYAQALHTARYIAVSGGRGVTICALDGRGQCSGNWNADLSLFYEDGRRGVLASERDLIAVIVVPPGDGTEVRWRGFGESRFLHVWPSGGYWQNGRFTFCPSPAREDRRGKAVIVNVLGRARVDACACP